MLGFLRKDLDLYPVNRVDALVRGNPRQVDGAIDALLGKLAHNSLDLNIHRECMRAAMVLQIRSLTESDCDWDPAKAADLEMGDSRGALYVEIFQELFGHVSNGDALSEPFRSMQLKATPAPITAELVLRLFDDLLGMEGHCRNAKQPFFSEHDELLLHTAIDPLTRHPSPQIGQRASGIAKKIGRQDELVGGGDQE